MRKTMRRCKKYMNKELVNLIPKKLEMYGKSPDRAHGDKHILYVMNGCIDICESIFAGETITRMAILAGLYHDIGLLYGGREDHHINGYKAFKADPDIKWLLSESEKEMIARAIYEHRASYKKAGGTYTSVISKIVSDADRSVDIEVMIERSYYYNKDHGTPEDEIYNEMYRHLCDKYGEARINPFFKITEDKLKKAQIILANEDLFRREYHRITRRL